MLACAPESGSRTPTFSGPLCARATLSGALAANNPVAAAPTVKLRRVMEFVGDARVMCGSPWMCLLAVACRFLLSSSLQDAMGHDGALRERSRDDPTTGMADRGRRPPGSEAISPPTRATMARPNLGCRRSEEAPMEESPVLVERRAGYRVITLNRPRQLNAFNEAMQQALKRT